MQRSLIVSIVAVLLATASAQSQSVGAGRLRAGAHKVDITPKESDLPIRSPTTFMSQRSALTRGHGPFVQTVAAPSDLDRTTPQGFNPQAASSERQPIPAANVDAYKKVLTRTGEYVHMLGAMIGSSAVRVMRESIEPSERARIWAAQETFTCPGRVRLDAANPARENVFPGYKDGPDVNLKVGVLRLGDIHFVTVNGEIYSRIAMRLKAESPASKTMVVTLANGGANSGYIYSDDAYSHLTFQVIGSRLKPGCAEGKIVATALNLMQRLDNGRNVPQRAHDAYATGIRNADAGRSGDALEGARGRDSDRRSADRRADLQLP